LEKTVDLDAADEEVQAAPAAPLRHGFLPIVTNWFDRVFISIYILVALELLWMRFLEQWIPLVAAHVIGLTLAVLIVWKG
jgi:predicted small integral membrane protein